MSTISDASQDDDVPQTFLQSWLAISKRTYKWTVLPIAIIVFFFMGDGWIAARVAQGYAETTGTVTLCTCGKSGVLQYSYSANDVLQHRTSPNLGCRRFSPGQPVRVFYSTQHPELSVVAATPRKTLMEALKVTLVSALWLPALAAFAVACKHQLSP